MNSSLFSCNLSISCSWIAHVHCSCFFLVSVIQRIKGNQIQKQIREEMDVLADQVTSLNAHRETQTQLVKKLEEREKALQNAVVR